MRVENSGKRPVIRSLNRILERLAVSDFLPQTFVDQHVRIHGHPDGEDHPGDAGEREGEAEHGHNPEQHDRVHNQTDDGDETGDAVVNQHEEERHDQCETTGDESLLNDGSTEGRGDLAHFIHR